jgi:hypothetical protein
LDSRDLAAGDFDAVAHMLDPLIRFHVEDRRDMIAVDNVPLDLCALNAWQDQSQKLTTAWRPVIVGHVGPSKTTPSANGTLEGSLLAKQAR